MERFITVKGRRFRAPISLGEGMGKSHLLWQGKGMQKEFLAAALGEAASLIPNIFIDLFRVVP